MNNILIWTNHRRWQKAARTIVYTASLLMLLGAAPAAAAKTCKKLIKACGCTAKKGHLTLANDLTSSSPSADCVTISGAHVVLDMAGHKITGPGGAATGAGIHVLAQGNGAFIDGVNQPISNFGTGILVEASDVVMAFVELRSNAQFGLKINGGSRNSMYNSDAGNESIASSGNGDTGVLITNGNDNLIDDIFASHNAKYGIHVSGGTNNSLHDLDGDFNGTYGIWIDGSNGARIVNSTGKSNGQVGLYIGCAPTGGIGGACGTAAVSSKVVAKFGQFNSNTMAGIEVDSGDLANQIGLNQINSNGSADAVDANASCGTNLWFLDSIGTTPAQTCVK